MSTRRSAPQDWHNEDIKAELRKRGWTFTRIAREYGYQLKTPDTVLRRPFGPMEQIIGELLGIAPARIWPSRYVDRERRKSERRGKERRRHPDRRRSERRKNPAPRIKAA